MKKFSANFLGLGFSLLFTIPVTVFLEHLYPPSNILETLGLIFTIIICLFVFGGLGYFIGLVFDIIQYIEENE